MRRMAAASNDDKLMVTTSGSRLSLFAAGMMRSLSDRENYEARLDAFVSSTRSTNSLVSFLALTLKLLIVDFESITKALDRKSVV